MVILKVKVLPLTLYNHHDHMTGHKGCSRFTNITFACQMDPTLDYSMTVIISKTELYRWSYSRSSQTLTKVYLDIVNSGTDTGC